jgi:hypothetical protein
MTGIRRYGGTLARIEASAGYRWNRYVAACTVIIGASLLFFPSRCSVIPFIPRDELWVRLTGMILTGISYLNLTVYRARLRTMIRPFILVNAAFGLLGIALAVTGYSPLLIVIGVSVLIGALGAELDFKNAVGSNSSAPARKRGWNRYWNLYVGGYTAAFALLALVVPDQAASLLGFGHPEGPWVRIAGVSFLALSFVNFVVFTEGGPTPMIRATMIARVWFLMVLGALALAGFPPFLYAVIAIVLIGDIGSAFTSRAAV